MRYKSSFLLLARFIQFIRRGFFALTVLLAAFFVLALDCAEGNAKLGHVKGMHDQKNYCVRVLLYEGAFRSFSGDLPGGNHGSIAGCNHCDYWEVESQNGFLVSDGTKDSKVFFCKSNKITINVRDNFIYLNNKKYLKKQVKISPKNGDLLFNAHYYQGNFILYLEDNKLSLVNKLDLEDYVYAVLRSESWPGWPLEVNKVFAIAIRTYVAKRVQGAKKSNRFYHIKNDNRHQTYRGYKYMKRNDLLLSGAVSKTRGIILTYRGDIIDPLYDSCCGSVITEHIENKINFEKAPYLARDYACNYCRKCSLYKWQVSYTLVDLENLLSQACPHIKNIKSIWVSKKDKAGLVKEIKVKCARRMYKITGEKLYSLLKEVKSFCFSLKKRGGAITITGKGYGHHIGLCQWGARQMVRELFDYKQILSFYYPGTSLVRLQ
ncbi:SpoIID/LytB domain-containing protein [Candidatus Dependentiae bacterium]